MNTKTKFCIIQNQHEAGKEPVKLQSNEPFYEYNILTDLIICLEVLI